MTERTYISRVCRVIGDRPMHAVCMRHSVSAPDGWGAWVRCRGDGAFAEPLMILGCCVKDNWQRGPLEMSHARILNVQRL